MNEEKVSIEQHVKDNPECKVSCLHFPVACPRYGHKRIKEDEEAE